MSNLPPEGQYQPQNSPFAAPPTPNGYQPPGVYQGHPYPGHVAPDQVPLAPPPPPRHRFLWAKITGLVLGGLMLIAVLNGLVNGGGPATPATPVPAPVSSAPHVEETAEPKPRKAEESDPPKVTEPPVEEPAEQRGETDLTFKQLRTALLKGYPEILEEDPNVMPCVGVVDLTNGLNYVGGFVVDRLCSDDVDGTMDQLVDAVGGDPSSRYSHYVRGSNWVVAFQTKAEAKLFAAGIGHGLKARGF